MIRVFEKDNWVEVLIVSMLCLPLTLQAGDHKPEVKAPKSKSVKTRSNKAPRKPTNCGSKRKKPERVYVFNDFKCYDAFDAAKGEGGRMEFTEDHGGLKGLDAAPFKTPAACKTANKRLSEYKQYIDKLVHAGKLNERSMEAEDIIAVICKDRDGYIDQIGFEPPPKKDIKEFDQARKADGLEQIRVAPTVRDELESVSGRLAL